MKKFTQSILACLCLMVSSVAYSYDILSPSSSYLYTLTDYQDNSDNDDYFETNSSVDYYTNSFGQTVQSPTYYNSKPSGATAECRDGTYSFSRSRRGTCSGHGGVEEWF